MAGADNNAGGGNEWELVSLTASTYAAAPGPVLPLLPHDKTEFHPPVPTPAIFMSQHFNLPPIESHASNLHGRQEEDEESTTAMGEDEGVTDDLDIPCPQINCEKEVQDDGLTRCSVSHKNLSTALNLEDAISSADAGNAVLQAGAVPVCLPVEEDWQAAIVGLHTAQPDAGASDSTSERQVSLGSDNTATVDSPLLTTAHVVPVAGAAACVAPDKRGPSSSSKIPREGHAWWNKTFSFLRSSSKESLTFRFIFVAATVVGLAILGQREKLQLRLEFNVDSEKISCAVREPIGQVKLSMIVGGRPVGVTN